MPARSTPPHTNQLAAELGECRQRGLDRLDVNTPPQSPVNAPQLERLARDYCTRAEPRLHGRIACIKRLLRDALDAYHERGNPTEAQLITELYFPPPESPTRSPGELLKQAAKNRGVTDEKKFRDDRRRALTAFAEFVVVFAQEKPPSEHRRRVIVINAAVIVVLLLATGLTVWLSTRETPDPSDAAHDPAASEQSTTIPPPPPGSTTQQTVNTPAGARTYRNPHSLVGEGQRINNHVTVEVSCKITATSAASAGRYWYRIASPPWNNQYHSPTNSFLNGDPPSGPHTQAVDPAVPDCPP